MAAVRSDLEMLLLRILGDLESTGVRKSTTNSSYANVLEKPITVGVLAKLAATSRSNVYNYPKVIERLRRLNSRLKYKSVRQRQIEALREENAELRRRLAESRSLLAAAYLRIEGIEAKKVVKLRTGK